MIESAMFDQIEEQFAAAGRTPKGRKALRAIYRATRQTVAESGLQEASLEIIAQRAGLTQASLRHYFATRDDLLMRFFITASEWFKGKMEPIIAANATPARERLTHCLNWHLEYMENVDTAFWLEASAYWLRRRPERRTRDEWYRWLSGQYATMIGEMRPNTSPRERRRRAYLMLSLILGAWITHGRGSALTDAGHVHQRRQLLIDAAMDIATE